VANRQRPRKTLLLADDYGNPKLPPKAERVWGQKKKVIISLTPQTPYDVGASALVDDSASAGAPAKKTTNIPINQMTHQAA
jgi:hypothetical protein